MRVILVPTDFSENAQHALDFAQEIASRYDAGISFLHAYHPPLIDPNLPADAMIAMTQELEKADAEHLETWVKECRAEGYACESKAVLGAASDVILDEIKAQKPIMVVMGRTGKGGWLDKVLGSVAAEVAAKATCPVLVLPPNTHPRTIKKIVYATELERAEEGALSFAFNLAEHFGAELDLVKVNAPFEVNIFDDEEYKADIQEIFGNKKYSLEAIESDSVVGGLQEYADENHADLIIMASRKRDWLSNIVNPSISKKLVLATHVPVLICHLDRA